MIRRNTHVLSKTSHTYNPKSPGFTIVELLIVVAIIVILATITIVSYGSVIKRANAVTLQGDLQKILSAVSVHKTHEGIYPASLDEANDGKGVDTSRDTTITYTADADGTAFCAQAQANGMSYFVTGRGTTPDTGTCSGFAGVPGNGVIANIPPNGGVVTTLAGLYSGYAEGSGIEARFNFPYGVETDAEGNIYVADYYNHRIRKITPSGDVSTVVGSGTPGNADGTSTTAQLNYPSDLEIDASGTMYIVDRGNHRIRKVSPSGTVTTLAGSSAGYVDSTGTAARFYYPYNLVLDGSGNVYVTDFANDRIRKVSPAGVVTTFAGSTGGYAEGTGTAAQFDGPYGIAIDAAGALYVGDSANQRIRKITSSGVVTTFAGSGSVGDADGKGAAAQFNSPRGIALDTLGNVYVADYSNHRVRKINPTGTVTTLAGSTQGTAQGTGSAAQFNTPWDVTVDASGKVYVSERHRIRKVE